MGGSNIKVKKPTGTEERMGAYVEATKEDGAQLVAQATELGQELEAKIKGYGTDYLAGLGEQERVVLARLQEANNWLGNQSNAWTDKFTNEVEARMADLNNALTLLSGQERSEMTGKISQWTDRAYQFDDQLRGEVAGAMDRFEQGTARTTKDFLDTTTSLGDRFLNAAQQAQNQYGDLMANVTDPGKTMDLFDSLSKRAQQTRMDLLATADPRALELSAIADENAAAMMSGRISADTQANLARSSAIRALQGGFGASSEMGRGLAARDLGLTSLDLQRQGTAMYDAQRRLNFDTRVAGIEQTAGSMTSENQRLRADQGRNIFASQMDTALSDRDSRLAAEDAAFRTRLSTLDARRGQDIAIASNLYDSRQNRERDALGLNLGVTKDFFNQNRQLQGLRFETGIGLARDVFNTGMNTANTIYGTNASAAENIYSANLSGLANVYGQHTSMANNSANLVANAAGNAFQGTTNARTAAAATIENAYQQAEARAAQSNASSNSMLGTALGLGGSLLGAVAGNAIAPGIGGMIGGSLVGGMAGSLAGSSLGGGGAAGAAQGMNMGMSAVGMYAGSGGTFGGGGGARTFGGYNPTPSSPYWGNVSAASARPVPVPAGMM